MPFSDARLLDILTHTLWFLPNVASCWAMHHLLTQDSFFKDYNIIVCAGSGAGIGVAALTPVLTAMGDPFKNQNNNSILWQVNHRRNCKNLWTGVFMLRNLKSPENLFSDGFQSSVSMDCRGFLRTSTNSKRKNVMSLISPWTVLYGR